MEEHLFAGRKIRTFTGKYLDVFEPNPDDIDIIDIAHGLSNQCRFGGHTQSFYSVAEHCYKASKWPTNDEERLAALMHDASEAYLLDFPRPIKNEMPAYKQIEYRLMEVIAEKFEFEWPLSIAVKEVDEYLLKYEWENKVLADNFTSLDPGRAKAGFLSRFQALKTGWTPYETRKIHINETDSRIRIKINNGNNS